MSLLEFSNAVLIWFVINCARCSDLVATKILPRILIFKFDNSAIPEYGRVTRGTAVVCHHKGTPIPSNKNANDILAYSRYFSAT